MFNIFKKKEQPWSFDQPKNCAVITLRQIINHDVPILVVYHDIDDDGWQFMSNIETTMEDMMLVSLEEITKIDSTVFEVSTIQPGYHAWRNNVGSKWIIEQTPPEDNE
jgi:hypothetical protein